MNVVVVFNVVSIIVVDVVVANLCMNTSKLLNLAK